jgi:hypothetical protein
MRRFMAESMDRLRPFRTALYKSLHDPTSPMDGSASGIDCSAAEADCGADRRRFRASVKRMIRLLVASGPLWWGRSERRDC